MFNRVVFKTGNKNKLTNLKLEVVEEDDVKKISDKVVFCYCHVKHSVFCKVVSKLTLKLIMKTTLALNCLKYGAFS